MRTKIKALTLALCAVLLVVTTVFVTMAFLTSTDEVKNTFTVGKVKITLDEADVDQYGEETADADRVKENEYKLIPGKTYTKDPTVHVDATSEDCYLFVTIKNGLDTDGTINGLEANGWALVADTTNVYCYYGVDAEGKLNADKAIVSAGESKKVFDTFTFGDEADPATYEAAAITVTAYAVQADGFEGKTTAETWAVFNG